MGEPATKFTELNAMRPESAAAKANLPDLSTLETKGYQVFPVASLRVLNTDPAARYPDAPWHRVTLGRGTYDVLLNGTFTYDLPQRFHMNPVGSVMRNGWLDTVGLDRSESRGGVALLEDGSIIVGRCQGNSDEDIQYVFGEGDLKVRDFMGGGALLAEYGQPVSSHDLREVQRFTSGQGGVSATQMQASDHAVLGIRAGQAFALMASGKSGRDIRSDLLQAGFATVVKFAGGSAAFLRDRTGERIRGTNSVGFGVNLRRY